MFHVPDHPEVREIELTGYPSWLREEEPDERDYDFEYESRKEEAMLNDLN